MHTFDSKLKRSSAVVSRRRKHVPYTVNNIKNNQLPHIRNILYGPAIQPKLIIGQPNDKYEQEADQVAKMVVQGKSLSVQKEDDPLAIARQPSPEEEEMLAEEGLQTKLDETAIRLQPIEEEEEMMMP